VNDVPAALEEARLIEYEHSELGTVRQVASPLRLSGDDHPVRPAPRRGEHTESVLVELCDYSSERVRKLKKAGVFGQ
jgi:crotonobetainyl-CoA:carnitine CoA-transferase CaiB-like acyl-CoA transferase